MTSAPTWPIAVAPFSVDQVCSMGVYQHCGWLPELPCRNAGCPGRGQSAMPLRASTDGLRCSQRCGYWQDWAPEVTTSWEWQNARSGLARWRLRKQIRVLLEAMADRRG